MTSTPGGAVRLIAALTGLADPDEVDRVARFYRGGDPDTRVMGIPIGRVFPVARKHIDLSVDDLEALLEDDRYEVRMAAVAIMDFKTRRKATDEGDRKALYDLYLRRHDRIDNWDLVDRAAQHVVGKWLIDRDRSVLDDLARSDDPHRRRTAIVATHAFIRQGETKDTFRIASLLAQDDDSYVQKAIGSWTREAGKRDEDALIAFLRAHADRLPRPTVTAASRRLPDEIRDSLRKG